MFFDTELFPNPTIANAVFHYCNKHSTPLPAQMEEHSANSVQWCEKTGALTVMMVNPLQAQLLVFLIRALNAKKVLEIGCFTGYSALAWAEGLKDVEGAEIVTLDLPGASSEFAQKSFEKYGIDGLVKLITGDAKKTIQSLAGKQFDMIFIDAEKSGYVTYLQQILDLNLLSPNGVVVADNALLSALVVDSSENNPASKYMGMKKEIEGIQNFNEFVNEKVKQGVLENVLLPLFDGLNIIRKAKGKN